MMHAMKSLFPFRLFGAAPEDAEPVIPAPNTSVVVVDEGVEASLLKTAAWITAGLGALALGLVIGRELRLRYKFNRRTPYDFYAHAGDEQEIEFGVGI